MRRIPGEGGRSGTRKLTLGPDRTRGPAGAFSRKMTGSGPLRPQVAALSGCRDRLFTSGDGEDDGTRTRNHRIDSPVL